MARNAWSPNEIKALRENAHLGWDCLKSSLPGRSRGATRVKAAYLGISISVAGYTWTKPEIELMRALLASGATAAQVAKALPGRTVKGILNKAWTLANEDPAFPRPQYRTKKKPEEASRSDAISPRKSTDDEQDLIPIRQSHSRAGEWHIDHPVKCRSIFELEQS